MSAPKQNLATRTFAHLLGRDAAAAKADDQDDDKKKDESAEDDKTPPKDDKEDGKRGESEDDKKDAKKAEGEDEDDKKKDESAEEDEPKKKDDTDEDERAELHSNSAAAKARNRERERCAAIFGHKAAAGRVATACNLAFNTRMTANEAISVLASLPAHEEPKKSGRSGLAEAMNTAPNPTQVGTSAAEGKAATATSAAAQEIIAAGAYRRGEKTA